MVALKVKLYLDFSGWLHYSLSHIHEGTCTLSEGKIIIYSVGVCGRDENRHFPHEKERKNILLSQRTVAGKGQGQRGQLSKRVCTQFLSTSMQSCLKGLQAQWQVLMQTTSCTVCFHHIWEIC